MAEQTIEEFNRECIEKIPPTELRRIHDESLEFTEKTFTICKNELCITTCTECARTTPVKHLGHVPCVVSILDMSTRCAACYQRIDEQRRCRQYLERHRPKLDVEDFARI